MVFIMVYKIELNNIDNKYKLLDEKDNFTMPLFSNKDIKEVLSYAKNILNINIKDIQY